MKTFQNTITLILCMDLMIVEASYKEFPFSKFLIFKKFSSFQEKILEFPKNMKILKCNLGNLRLFTTEKTLPGPRVGLVLVTPALDFDRNGFTGFQHILTFEITNFSSKNHDIFKKNQYQNFQNKFFVSKSQISSYKHVRDQNWDQFQ